MPVIGKNLRETVQSIAQVSGMDHFFIQDTETTGIDLNNDQIYEIAGIEYDHGIVRPIHYYLDRPEGVSYDKLKNTAAGKNGNKKPWANIISDKNFDDLKNGKISNYHGGKYLSTKDAAKFIKTISSIPNITYNAIFDISMEMKLDKSVKFNNVYDAATMVIDVFPQILQIEDMDDLNKNGKPKTGHWNLQLIYKYLRDPKVQRSLGLSKSFPSGYGGKILKNEEHTAYSDTVNMLIPVLGVISDVFKKNPNWKWENFKNKQAVATYFMDKQRAQYKKVGIEMKPFNPATLKKVGADAQGFLTLPKNAKLTLCNYSDVDSLLSGLPGYISSGEKIMERISTKTQADNAKALKKLTKDVAVGGKYNTGNLLRTMDASLRKQGFSVGYNFGGAERGILEVELFPNDEAFILQLAAKKVKPIYFRINLQRADGLINLDGRKAINKLFTDYQGGKAVVITAEQAQLIDIIQYINSGTIKTLAMQGRYDLIGKRISEQVRQAMHTLHAAQNYVSDDTKQEESKNLSGTGTARQRWIRENYLDNSRYLTHIIDHNEDVLVKACLRAGFQGVRSKEAALSKIVGDLNDILTIFGTLGPTEATKELNRQRKRLGYLTESNAWRGIVKSINQISTLHFHPGISSESSLSHMTVSLMNASSLTAGGMTRLDTRHQQQIAATRALSGKAKEYREKLARQGRIFNEFEVKQNGINHGSIQEALSSYAYITQSDINKAYKEVRRKHPNLTEREFIKIYGTGNIGIHNDASVFSLGSDFQNLYLDSFNKTTKVIKDADYQRIFNLTIISMVGKHKIPSKFTQKELTDMLLKGDVSGIDEVYRSLSDEKKEQISNRVIRNGVRKELNLSNVNFKDVKIDYTEVDYIGGGWRVPVYTPSKMESGTKILSKVDGFRTNAQGIHQEVFQQILADKGVKNVDLLKELPEEFSSEGMEGLIIGYLNNIVSTVFSRYLPDRVVAKKAQMSKAAQEILNVLNMDNYGSPSDSFVNALKGIMRWDNKQKSFIMIPGALQKAMKDHKIDGILKSLNQLGTSLSIPKGFVKIKDGVWNISREYVGMSAVNQAQIDEYGDPSQSPNGVVKLDYRARQSIESSVALARGSKSSSLKGIEKYILGQMKSTSSDSKRYNNLKKDIEKSIQITTLSASKQFQTTEMQTRKNNAVSVGYGANYDVDISKWDTNLYEDGQFSKDLYNNSLFKKIEEAKKVKAKQFGVKSGDVEVYLDLEKTYTKLDRYSNGTGRGAAIRYLFLPKLSPLSDDWANMDFPDMPSYVKEFNKTISGIRRIHESNTEGWSKNRIDSMYDQVGSGAFSMIERSLDVVNFKDSSIWQGGNSRKVTHSGNGVATAGNASWITDKTVTKIQKQIASTDSVISFEDAIAAIKSDGVHKSDNEKQIVKKRLAHLGVLKANIDYLWEDSLNENTVQKVLTNALSEYVSKRVKFQPNMTEAQQRDLVQKELKSPNITELKNTLLLMLGFNKDSKDYSYLSTTKYEQQYKQVSAFLTDFIAESVTIGSIVMGDRVHQERALQVVLGRYPFSNGLDLKYTQTYIDKGMTKGRITVGLGVGRAFNLDYDGDHVPYWLAMMSGEGLGAKAETIEARWKKNAQEFEVLKNWQKKITSFLALTESEDIVEAKEPVVYSTLDNLKKDINARQRGALYYVISEGNAYKWNAQKGEFEQTSDKRGAITQSTADELFEFQQQVKAVLAGRKYKTQTGSLSNIYQMVANTLHEHGFDEMGLRSKNKTQRQRAIRSLVVRAFYEAFTQDAISSKKVFNRLKGNKDAKEAFYFELNELVEKLKSENTYTDQGLNDLFAKLNKMGLSTISDRIAFQVLVTARIVDKDGSSFNSIFGAGAASKFNLKFKADGEIESINGINFETDREQAMAIVRSLVDKDKGFFNKDNNAAMKRAILGTDEDLRNFGDREIAGLARAINNAESKKDYGMHMASLSDYGEAYTALLQDITEDAQKIVQKNWHKITQEQSSLHNKKYSPLENGKNVKFEASMESFKQSISAFKTAAGKTQRFSIIGVHTGLDTTNGQHRTYIDSSAYGDDYDTYEFLNNYIKSGAVYTVTQLAGVLHIGDYKSSNTYSLEYGTMIHNIIEKILQPRVNNKLDQKLSECFKNVETAPDAASAALKEWLIAQWAKGNTDDQTDVMACFKDGQIEPVAFGNTFKEVSTFIRQVSESGYLKDSEFATQFVEKTAGILVRNGEESFIISGTIDQLWHAVQAAEAQYELSDFKTSKYAYLEYVIQLSLYNAILRASNIDTNKYGKLFINNLKGSSVVDVEALSDDKLFEFISEAIPVLQCTDSSRRNVMILQLANKWNPRLMNHMTLRLTQKEGGGYLYGGSSLSNVVKNLDKNFPVTQKEANLRMQYDVARRNGEPHIGSLEQYIAYLHRNKNMSDDDYQEHLKFRGYRAKIVQNYINSYESETARGIVQDSLLRYGKDNYSNLSIISDYYAATHGQNKVEFYDIEKFQNEFKIDENTYNYYGNTKEYGGLGFNRNEQTGGEDEMALVEDLIKFLQSYTPGAKGSSSGGTAPGEKIRYTDPDKVKESMGLIGDTDKLVKEYAKELHNQEIEQLKLQLFEDKDSVEYKIANQRYKNKYEGLEWDSDKNDWVRMKDSNGKEYEGILSSLEKRLYILLHDNENGDKDRDVSKRDIEADTESVKKIEEAEKMKNNNLEYQKEVKDINQKIEQQDLKILEKKKKLYGELLVLQQRLNVAKRAGNQEEIDSVQSLVDAKQAEYDKNGELDDQEAEKRKRELQPKLTKIDEDDRKQKERQYKSLLSNRESLSKQIYRNQQAQKLTYSVQERRALQDEAEILNDQWNESEESISNFRNTYSGYWDIQEPDGSNRMASLESRSSTKMARDMASVDVSNRGQNTLWGQLGSQMTNTLYRFTQMGAAYKIIGQVRQGINQLVTSAKELDKSLTNLRIVTGSNNSEARQMMATYADLGDELGATTTEVANSAEEWLRQGYEMNEVTDLVTASIYLSKLGMMDASTATKDLTNIKSYKYVIIQQNRRIFMSFEEKIKLHFYPSKEEIEDLHQRDLSREEIMMTF